MENEVLPFIAERVLAALLNEPTPNKYVIKTNTRAYKLALQAVITRKKVYTIQYSGSKRFTKTLDDTAKVIEIIKFWGYDYYTGNDAPKGGRCGTFIVVI